MSRKGENIYKRKDGRWEGRYKKGKTAEGRTRVFDSPIVKKPLKPHCSSQKFCQEICFMG